MDILDIASSRPYPVAQNIAGDLEGQTIPRDSASETKNTVVVKEQTPAALGASEVVEQAAQNAPPGLETKHFGGTIDITV